jgi:hypothetical protein
MEERGQAWQVLLLDGLQADLQTARECYGNLSQTACSYDDIIRRDIGRTLPEEELFRLQFGKGQSALFRVLRALANQNWDIGYVQSLNFVVATLITVFPDDEALVFRCAQSLLFRFTLADFYRPCFPQLGVILWQFDRLVEGLLPKAHAALDAHGVTAEYYAMQWFLTLFAYDLPQCITRRVWDRFLIVGWHVIVQVALALVAEIQDELWDLDTCEAMTLLKVFVRKRRFKAEALLDAASKYPVSHRMLSELEAAYSRGEDPEDIRLVVEEDDQTGDAQCVVRRRRRRTSSGEMSRRRSSSRSLSSAAEELPRAFHQGGTTRARSFSPCSSNSSSTFPAPRAVVSANGTVLPFLIHNLDTGETCLLEEEYSEYARESVARESAGELSLHQPCRGSFWLEGQQSQALRLLGKA